jgi:N-methylhydantoinase A/oxoprolinase/acetone carboxylase beta subunit
MGRVSAFAISATFGVRNPAHEVQLRHWVQEMCDVPVTCGHELASSLGAPRRALTAALNARMIFHVKALIESVQRTLAARAIDAPNLRAYYRALIDSDAFRILTGRLSMSYDGGQILD